MYSRVISIVGIMLLIASGLIFGQIVEKYSSSFAFPLTLTSVNGMRSAADQPSFFRTVHCFAQKGIVTFYYGVPSNASQGYIAMYLVSGELVKKFMLLKSHGSVQCDLSHAPAGLYLASISCGTYRHTLKLALSR